MISFGMTTIDTPNPRMLAEWWAARLGGRVREQIPDEFCVMSAPGLPGPLGFQFVEHATLGKNRLHLDFIRSAGHDRLQVLAAFVAAGATHLARHHSDSGSWDVCEDPDGNQFCLTDPNSTI